MFTGLIQTTGTIRSLTSETIEIAWRPSTPLAFLEGMAIGDSIAVNGICLTVTQIRRDSFWAAVSPETVERTILGQAQISTVVNLEASLRVGNKIGGHFVTGHIDGVGYFQASTQTANAWEIRFSVPDVRVAKYIVPKGSVAVNGISLTIADCDPMGAWFTVAVIPLTYAETNLQYLKNDDPVNIEGDVLGKYVETFLRWGDSTVTNSSNKALDSFGALIHNHQDHNQVDKGGDRTDLTADFLSEHGYQ